MSDKDLAAMADDEAQSKSLFGKVKEAFLLINTARLIYVTMKAGFNWKSLKGQNPMSKSAFKLLTFNALIILLVCIYKFTVKDIAPLYVLQSMAGYSAFCCLPVLIKSVSESYNNGEKAVACANQPEVN